MPGQVKSRRRPIALALVRPLVVVELEPLADASPSLGYQRIVSQVTDSAQLSTNRLNQSITATRYTKPANSQQDLLQGRAYVFQEFPQFLTVGVGNCRECSGLRRF